MIWRTKLRSIFAVLVLGFLGLATEAWAQPRAFLQWGVPQGLDNRLNIARVPVSISTGVIKYYDVALTFTVDSAGRLVLNTTATKITPSPELTVGAFRPGIYEDSGDCEYTVGAPGVAGGGRVSGSLGGGSGCFDELSVSWVSGPIAGHPNEAALRSAGITFQGYSWGILGEAHGDWVDLGWAPGDLVGVVQSGQQLTVHNFGNDNREDSSAVFTFCSSCR
jgi:hypothetical protein